MKNVEDLIKRLLTNGVENETVEFKLNFDKQREGQNISALANSAALLGKEYGYILIGVENESHVAVGTTFSPDKNKVGNMPIKNWLAQMMEPKVSIEFAVCTIEGKQIVIIRIPAAINRPIKFENISYIRIGEVTRKLSDFPPKEEKIWNNIKNRNFERGIALDHQTGDQILSLLDYDKYFQLTKQDLPSQTRKFLDKLSQDKIVVKRDDGSYKVTVLGAILFARNIEDFPIVKRKSVRVITYKGNTKEIRKNEQSGTKGYAAGFEGLVDYINSQIPNNEEINKALRVEKKMYPDIAIREFVANALIHQDFSIKGAGPMIEIFDNRIEITNPGVPLIDVDRFIDHPPRSRNEDIASMMRRAGFCEESGSGVDRALLGIELFQLPAPKFEQYSDFTKVTLFAHRSLREMTTEDKTRACYQHCVLKYLSREGNMTNRSLRERLSINESNYPTASKIIAESVKRGLIKEAEKSKEYVPWWA